MESKEIAVHLDFIGKAIGVERHEVVRRIHEACDRNRIFYKVLAIEKSVAAQKLSWGEACDKINTIKNGGF